MQGKKKKGIKDIEGSRSRLKTLGGWEKEINQ